MARLPVLLILTLAGSGCADACSNTVVSEAGDPAGGTRAIMFQRDCGATTGFSTQISVTGDEGPPTGRGNAYIADDDHGAASTADWGGPWTEMKWIGPGHLRVRYAAGSRIFERNERVSGVRITYEAVHR